MRSIIGVDPGVTTGLCHFIEKRMLSGAEVKDARSIVAYIKKHHPDVVVVEDFIVSRLPANVKDPLKVIGIVEYVCNEMGIKVVIQSPGILNRMMKRTSGMHSSVHVRSACAHVLYYLETS